MCVVYFRDHNKPGGHCTCNVSCHQRDDCCPDAEEIGCICKFDYTITIAITY